MRRGRWFFAVLLVALLVSGLAVAPGLSLAQSENETVGTDGEPGDGGDIDVTVTDSDGNESGGNESGEGEDDDGLLGGDGAPSGTTGTGNGLATSGGTQDTAGGFLDGTREWAVEGATNAIPDVIDGTLGIATGAPTMDNSGWLGIFGTPTAEPHATLFDEIHEGIIFPLTLSFLVIALLLSASALPFSDIIGRYNASKWVMTMFVLILAISLSWPIVSAMHALADSIGTSIAPSSEELLGSDEGLRTLGGASVAGAAGFYLFGWLKVIIYGLIYGMRYFLLMMVFPYIFPLALTAALAAPWRKARAFGSGILWQHVGFLLIGWPVALLWRAAYVIDWSFGLDGLASVLMIIGSLVAGVVIPVAIMYQMTRMTGVVSGAVAGAGASLAARESYKPKSVDHAKTAGSRARDVGRSASSYAHSAAQTVKQRAVATDGGTTQTHTSSDRGRARRNSGSTQSTRKKAAQHMVQQRKRRQNRHAQRGD